MSGAAVPSRSDLDSKRERSIMRLKDKAALVTGAGQGFGFGIAEAFVREGARVACLDVKGDVAEAAAKRFGASAMAVQADVSSRKDVERAARAAIDALGRIDIVVNNAGVYASQQAAHGG